VRTSWFVDTVLALIEMQLKTLKAAARESARVCLGLARSKPDGYEPCLSASDGKGKKPWF
jgi:hypothetical protein